MRSKIALKAYAKDADAKFPSFNNQSGGALQFILNDLLDSDF